nr:MAG TPA: hypothetical protein [Caudoviricetes sp.]
MFHHLQRMMNHNKSYNTMQMVTSSIQMINHQPRP